MVNKVVLDYLKKNYGKYKFEELKREILDGGYSEQEIEEALKALKLEKGDAKKVRSTFSEDMREEIAKSLPKDFSVGIAKLIQKKQAEEAVQTSGKMEVKPVEYRKSLKPLEEARKISHKHSKWFKVAGIAGIVFFVIMAIFVIINLLTEVNFLSPFYFISFVLAAIFYILFFYGFVVLGRVYNKKLIELVSLILILIMVFFIVFQILLIVFKDPMVNFLFGSAELVSRPFELANVKDLFGGDLILIIFSVVIVLIFSILNIIFGLEVKKLKDNIENAKIAGILHIIGGALLITGIGALVLIFTLIFDIILLFKESKKS